MGLNAHIISHLGLPFSSHFYLRVYQRLLWEASANAREATGESIRAPQLYTNRSESSQVFEALRLAPAMCYTFDTQAPPVSQLAGQTHAPIAQWIEHRPPEPGAGVRVALGAPSNRAWFDEVMQTTG